MKSKLGVKTKIKEKKKPIPKLYVTLENVTYSEGSIHSESFNGKTARLRELVNEYNRFAKQYGWEAI